MAAVTDDDDATVRALIASGEIDRATTDTLRVYGPELIGWMCSMLPGEADAHEAFSWMSEQLWKSLPRWEARCSLRTWCYMLARHAVIRTRTRSRSRLGREDLVASVPSIAHAVTHVWNTSRANAAQTQSVYTEIRNTLDDDEQTLLVLRVDRSLAWRDIAIVLLGEEASKEDIAAKAASLRKQFERMKERLRSLAAEKLRDD